MRGGVGEEGGGGEVEIEELWGRVGGGRGWMIMQKVENAQALSC